MCFVPDHMCPGAALIRLHSEGPAGVDAGRIGLPLSIGTLVLMLEFAYGFSGGFEASFFRRERIQAAPRPTLGPCGFSRAEADGASEQQRNGGLHGATPFRKTDGFADRDAGNATGRGTSRRQPSGPAADRGRSLPKTIAGVKSYLQLFKQRSSGPAALFQVETSRPAALPETSKDSLYTFDEAKRHCDVFVVSHWLRRGSNPHGGYPPQDFKSCASASSATQPKLLNCNNFSRASGRVNRIVSGRVRRRVSARGNFTTENANENHASYRGRSRFGAVPRRTLRPSRHDHCQHCSQRHDLRSGHRTALCRRWQRRGDESQYARPHQSVERCAGHADFRAAESHARARFRRWIGGLCPDEQQPNRPALSPREQYLRHEGRHSGRAQRQPDRRRPRLLGHVGHIAKQHLLQPPGVSNGHLSKRRGIAQSHRQRHRDRRSGHHRRQRHGHSALRLSELGVELQQLDLGDHARPQRRIDRHFGAVAQRRLVRIHHRRNQGGRQSAVRQSRRYLRHAPSLAGRDVSDHRRLHARPAQRSVLFDGRQWLESDDRRVRSRRDQLARAARHDSRAGGVGGRRRNHPVRLEWSGLAHLVASDPAQLVARSRAVEPDPLGDRGGWRSERWVVQGGQAHFSASRSTGYPGRSEPKNEPDPGLDHLPRPACCFTKSTRILRRGRRPCPRR